MGPYIAYTPLNQQFCWVRSVYAHKFLPHENFPLYVPYILYLILVSVVLFSLEYAIMKCLNLIGLCEGSKSLRATIHTPGYRLTIATTVLFKDTLKNFAVANLHAYISVEFLVSMMVEEYIGGRRCLRWRDTWLQPHSNNGRSGGIIWDISAFIIERVWWL